MMWNWFFHRRSVRNLLVQLARILELKGATFHRLPTAAVSGDYFGLPLAVEGSRKGEGYRFFAAVELPQAAAGRYFLMHEKRKASFKPVASLKWITTTHARFNQNYLLLSDREATAQAVFQNYLCARISGLPILDWQMDIHGSVTHFEIFEPRLNAAHLGEILKAGVEVLNAVLTAEAVKPDRQKE